MKKTRGQRWLFLLLTLAMCLALAPAAWAAEEGGTKPTISTKLTGALEPRLTAEFTLENAPDGATVDWSSSNPEVATVHYNSGLVTGVSAGTATITATYKDGDATKTATRDVIVSGIAVNKDKVPVVVYENGDFVSLKSAITFYGNARESSLYFTSRDTYTAEVSGVQVRGLRVGETTVDAVANDGTYRTTIAVRVDPDLTTRIPQDAEDKQTLPLKSGETLPFSDLTSYFNSQLGGDMQYVTGLFVPTDQGTLYYNYRSEAEPGAGVGQVETYYRNPSPGQRKLSDITFVPKPGYVGGTVTITYNAITGDGRTYSCKIVLTVQGSSGSDSSSAGSISLNTNYNTAVNFNSTEFGAVCREKTGTQLDYVIFAQPPERQGALYTNYSSSGNYGSVVDVHKQYSRRDLDDVWFVPAPGYRGTVTVYYTGYATNGKSYSAQVNIQVGQEESLTTSGLLSYDVAPGGAVRFTVEKFNDYCREILDEDQSISGIRFESLPSESEGALYYDYRSASYPGSRAVPGTVYYPGTREPRIDRLFFVASESFTGTLRLPFTGWTTDGTSFSGNVELNVRGGAASGDIYYYCAPGQTVRFASSDFTSLCRTITDRTLSYIRFLELPSTSEGYLYINTSTRVSTGRNYTSSDISNIRFRAYNNFSGWVTVPFEGYSTGTNPIRFTGIITIGSGSSGSGGSSTNTTTNTSTSDVIAQYSTRTAPVRFYAGDLEESGATLSSIRFTSLPSSGAGYLYYQYTSPTQYGQQVNTGTTYQTSGSNLISNLAFVPRAGYSGTVAIPYTGTNSNKTTFSGEVIITVSPTYSSYYFSDMAGYSSSQIAAVDFLYDHNITYGLTTGQYGPESFIRRGDFALMLYQAFEFFPVSGGSFADVSPDAYYATAVNTLYARGVVSGTGGGYYSPDSSLTRQDAICMVQRAMQAIGWNASDGYTSALSGYGDSASVSGYAQGAMALAVQRGYLPTSGGWLNPQQPLTRVDMAELLHRALTY